MFRALQAAKQSTASRADVPPTIMSKSRAHHIYTSIYIYNPQRFPASETHAPNLIYHTPALPIVARHDEMNSLITASHLQLTCASTIAARYAYTCGASTPAARAPE